MGYIVNVYRTGFMGVKFLVDAETFKNYEDAENFAIARQLQQLISCTICKVNE